MTERTVDSDIRLIPYYRNDAASLPWYQDPDVCKQVDDRDTPYDLELLHSMYDYLSSHGGCWYIEYRGVLVGDVSLRDNGEIAIVVCKRYQNRHIGRRCVMDMLALARERGWSRSRRISIPSTGRASVCFCPRALRRPARNGIPAGCVYKDIIFDTKPIARKVYKNSENRTFLAVFAVFVVIRLAPSDPTRSVADTVDVAPVRLAQGIIK